MHINSLIDDNVLDFAHLNESCGLAAGGVAVGDLDAQRANDQERLMIHLHKVDVKHHPHQRNEDRHGENGRVLSEEKQSVCNEPHGAGGAHHFPKRHFW